MAGMTGWKRLRAGQAQAAGSASAAGSAPAAAPKSEQGEGPKWSGRFGLLAKITTFLFLILIPLAALTWMISVQSLRSNLTTEFTSKGTAIAKGLANSGVDLLLTRDASTVQAQVDQVAGITGVAYVMVYDAQKTLIAHTFAPFVPPGLVDQNLVAGDWPQKVQDVIFKDPAGRGDRDVIDIAVPILAGQLGTVRVGMDRSIITTAANEAGRNLLLTFGGFAVAAALAGIVFARLVTRPVHQLVRVAEQVGRGDLSRLAPVQSRDEIGQLAVTFNDSIVRLRSLVQTVAERDAERRQRQELQANISRFLDVTTEVSRGDLTRRGEVTSDVLGSVVDSINVMVGEIAAILVDVRQAAHHVSTSANEMIVSMGQIETGSRAQARDAMQATGTAEQLGSSRGPWPAPRMPPRARRGRAWKRPSTASRRCGTAWRACSASEPRCRAYPRRSRASASGRSRSPTSSTRSTTSPRRPTSSPSMRPSRRPAPARPASASPSWPTRCGSWRSARPTPPRTSRSSSRTSSPRPSRR
jgi:methyl-accepting chemotaxis protein